MSWMNGIHDDDVDHSLVPQRIEIRGIPRILLIINEINMVTRYASHMTISSKTEAMKTNYREMMIVSNYL